MRFPIARALVKCQFDCCCTPLVVYSTGGEASSLNTLAAASTNVVSQDNRGLERRTTGYWTASARVVWTVKLAPLS